MFLDLAGVIPLVVVIADKARVTGWCRRFGEALLARQHRTIGFDNRLGPAFPQLLDIAQEHELKALLPVMIQRGQIGLLALLEVVGGVTLAFVQVGEDDQPQVCQLAALFGTGGCVDVG